MPHILLFIAGFCSLSPANLSPFPHTFRTTPRHVKVFAFQILICVCSNHDGFAGETLCDGLPHHYSRRLARESYFLHWPEMICLHLSCFRFVSFFVGRSSVPLIQNLGCVQVPVFPRAMLLLSEQDTGLGWSPPTYPLCSQLCLYPFLPMT